MVHAQIHLQRRADAVHHAGDLEKVLGRRVRKVLHVVLAHLLLAKIVNQFFRRFRLHKGPGGLLGPQHECHRQRPLALANVQRCQVAQQPAKRVAVNGVLLARLGRLGHDRVANLGGQLTPVLDGGHLGAPQAAR